MFVEGGDEGGVGVAAVGEGLRNCGWACEGWFKLLGGRTQGEMLGRRQDRGKGWGLGHWVVVSRRVSLVLVESLYAPEMFVALCTESRVFDAGVLGSTSASLETFVAGSTWK